MKKVIYGYRFNFLQVILRKQVKKVILAKYNENEKSEKNMGYFRVNRRTDRRKWFIAQIRNSLNCKKGK